MNTKIISACITAIIMLALLVVTLIFGYYPPDPPIPEEGVEVAMGYDEAGLGNEAPAQNMPNHQQAASSGNYSTQNTEESVSLPDNSRGNTTDPRATETKKPEQKEPEINRNALYTGRKTNTSSGSGQGNTQGNGQQGNENGTAGASNYDGESGSGGVSFSLAGRSKLSLSLPPKDFSREGKIVVKIWVDRQGKVTKAAYQPFGSNIADETMVNQAVQAALHSKFKPDAKATAVQTGTITYEFRKGQLSY